jgi:hypothetical protein
MAADDLDVGVLQQDILETQQRYLKRTHEQMGKIVDTVERMSKRLRLMEEKEAEGNERLRLLQDKEAKGMRRLKEVEANEASSKMRLKDLEAEEAAQIERLRVAAEQETAGLVRLKSLEAKEAESTEKLRALEEKLADEVERFRMMESTRKKLRACELQGSQLVKLNVGGTKYATTRSNLLRVEGGFFHGMLESDTWAPNSDGTLIVWCAS